MNSLLSPHRRFNPLTGQWILVSPQRGDRPWKGQVEKIDIALLPSHDQSCNLCPGNIRTNEKKNPNYTSTFVFPNDFPALLTDTKNITDSKHPLFTFQNQRGECRVICFSPLHNITLAEMNNDDILQVINTWILQLRELNILYKWVQIFENKGAMMGASNPHPHSQIWAGDFIPTHIAQEDVNQKQYYQKNNSPMLLEYVNEEIERKDRVILENKFWAAIVPFWAIWPFEIIILPRFHTSRMQNLTQEQKISLANILKIILVLYDNLFETPFPYSMGIHEAPIDHKNSSYWQFHIHLNPPLLRSATIKKFMVGYEMFAEAQRDLTPEQAAEKLKSLSSIHYKTR